MLSFTIIYCLDYRYGGRLVEDIYVDDSREAFTAMTSLTLLDGKLDRNATIMDPEQIPNKPKSKITKFASYREGTVHIPIGIVGHNHRPSFGTCILPTANINGVYESQIDYFIQNRIEELEFGGYDQFLEIHIDLNKLPKNVSTKKPSWFKKGYEGYVDFDSMLHDLFFRKVLVNPGSVGQPRNRSPEARYMIIELGKDGDVTLNFKEVAYDIETTQRKLGERCYPRQLAERLGMGR